MTIIVTIETVYTLSNGAYVKDRDEALYRERKSAIRKVLEGNISDVYLDECTVRILAQWDELVNAYTEASRMYNGKGEEIES